MSSLPPASSCQRLQLLDFLRGLAILCVVIDHIFAWIGAPEGIMPYLPYFIFSVGPLFFLAGITYALSYWRHPAPPAFIPYLRLWWRKASRLLFAYLVGLFAITIWRSPSFSLLDYWRAVWVFPHQYYFISIYLQLLLLGPFLAQIWPFCQKILPFRSFWLKLALPCLILLLIGLISGFFPVFGAPETWTPAKMLFGGIELWIFSLGTMFAYLHRQRRLTRLARRPLWLLTAGVTSLAALLLSGHQGQIFHHPPSLATIWYCASLFLIFTATYQLACRARFTWFIKLLSAVGRHSLDIFIFHTLLIRELLLHTPPAWYFGNLLWQFAYLTLGACLGSIILTFLLDQVFKLVNSAFQPARL